jgi:hypothetical protein
MKSETMIENNKFGRGGIRANPDWKVRVALFAFVAKTGG